MFTGIIEDKGRVLRVERREQARRLSLQLAAHLTELQLGDSISINGVCLTVMDKKGQAVELDLSSETLERTALGTLKEGDQVNVERALRLADRLGGHIVTGHIDGTGVISGKRRETDFLHLWVRIPSSVTKYVVPKGSIAIDGISLTVNECEGDEIRMTLIPHTVERTTLIHKNVGDQVNVETDILGKYVEKLLSREGPKSGGVDVSLLREYGFIKGE